ncbi:MAG: dihydroorotate dehydrogenase electron transfer subunit [Acidobacteriota bacterium]|nr:dihydroorotate dehydrogenase electron transfer subunit [Acidobacteriota bacterium]
MSAIANLSKCRDAVAVVERNDFVASASARSYGLLRLRPAQTTGVADVLPGQFAMLKPHGSYEPLLRRAMAYYRCDASSVEFIYQILGRGTQMLARLKAGDSVDLLGPLGNTFETAAARDTLPLEALLVAGGAGSPALFMLGEKLLKAGVITKLFIGGASRGDLCGLDDFIELLSASNIVTATIDGSHGAQGFVTSPLEKYLQTRHGLSTIIYACGPEPMLHATAMLAERFDIPAQVSLESPMACGFGICVGCAVAVRAAVGPDCPEGFVYKKVCTDGPVFWSKDLHWQ